MKGPTHRFLGGCAAFGVSRALDLGLPGTGVLVVIAARASSLPDQIEGGVLSHRGVTHRIWMTAVVGAAVMFAVIIGTPPLMEWTWTQMHLALPTVFSPHAPWWTRNVAWILALLLAGGVTIGYGAHLAADAMTRAGLKVGGRHVHLLPRWLQVRTGGASETVFNLVVILLIGLYAYLAWWPE